MQYRDWEGIVYPKPRSHGFYPLSYIAGFFDLVEINSPFYGPPQRGASRGWVARVGDHPDFRFTAILWKGFAHERNATAEDEKGVQKDPRHAQWPKFRCTMRMRYPSLIARAIKNKPTPTATAPIARATRAPSGAMRSTVIAAATTAIARRSMTPMTRRIAISPAQQ